MQPVSPGNLRGLLFLLFTVSGFSGLIYESLWTHYLKLILGHAAYAQTLVLAIFMGGMALGAWLAGRWSHRWRNPLLGYAVVEGVIGLMALAFHALFLVARETLFQKVVPGLEQPLLIDLVQWSIAAVMILPQSILLGTTFPLMSAGIIRMAPEKTGASLGMLYFTNSLGAAAGALVSAFLLIQWVGLPGTLRLAGFINIALALVVGGLALGRSGAGASTPAPAETVPDRALKSTFVRLILAASFLTGLASFFYEIAWIRMLSLVMGSATQSFELMLSAFILGLALGGLWIRRRLDRIKKPIRYAGYVQVLMGLFALLTLPLYNYTFDFMGFLITSLAKSDGGYFLFTLSSHALALAVMLPATIMAGMTLPLFTFILMKGGQGEKSIGHVYAANTVGAIVGVLIAVHLIMPGLGVRWLINLGALCDVGLGLVLLGLVGSGLKGWKFSLQGGAALLLALVFALTFQCDGRKMASGVYREGRVSIPEGTEILFHKDGKTATIDLLRYPSGTLSITTNGKSEGSISSNIDDSDEVTQVLLGVLPLVMHPQAKTVAAVGMGSGMSTHMLLGAESLERVDTIEIEAAMLEAAQRMGKPVARAFEDPRSHIHVEDAKTFFARTHAKYDLIISEPSNPWVSGVAGLFTTEFYESMAQHLEKDGLFVQWLQLYNTNPSIVSSVFKALSPHFSDYVVYNTMDVDVLIMATNGLDLSHADPWVFTRSRLGMELEHFKITNIRDFEVRRISNKAVLQPLFASTPGPMNSDYFPYMSCNASRCRYLGRHVLDLTLLHSSPVPVCAMLEGRGRQDLVLCNPSHNFEPAMAAQFANSVVNMLTSPQGVSGTAGSKPLPAWVRLLALEFSLAGDHLPNDRLVRDGIFDLAGATNSLLPPPRLVPMWDLLLRQPGYSKLSDETQAWFRMHQAVAERDSKTMAALAGIILDRYKGEVRPDHFRYLAVAGLCGLLSSGEKEGAWAFWEKYGPLNSIQGSLPIDLQLLVSHLEQ